MKKIIFAASMLALTLSSHTIFAKEVLFSCSKEYTNKNYHSIEETEYTPPGSYCADETGHCTITVIAYDDYTGEIQCGEMVIPFNDPNPIPSQESTQQILDDVDAIIATGGILYQDYQP